jgi:hypothetical protein
MIPCVDIGIIALDALSELSQADLKKMCSTCNASNQCDMTLGNSIKMTTKQDTPRTASKSAGKQVNLILMAQDSLNFDDFQNRAHDPDVKNRYAKKPQQPRNLAELAVETKQENGNFADFHKRAEVMRRREA